MSLILAVLMDSWSLNTVKFKLLFLRNWDIPSGWAFRCTDKFFLPFLLLSCVMPIILNGKIQNLWKNNSWLKILAGCDWSREINTHFEKSHEPIVFRIKKRRLLKSIASAEKDAVSFVAERCFLFHYCISVRGICHGDKNREEKKRDKSYWVLQL